MEQEIKDILISIQGTLIKIQQNGQELNERVSNLEQGQQELKLGQEELKEKVDKLDKNQQSLFHEVFIPIRDNQNAINKEIKQSIQKIAKELQSIKKTNYVQKVI